MRFKRNYVENRIISEFLLEQSLKHVYFIAYIFVLCSCCCYWLLQSWNKTYKCVEFVCVILLFCVCMLFLLFVFVFYEHRLSRKDMVNPNHYLCALHSMLMIHFGIHMKRCTYTLDGRDQHAMHSVSSHRERERKGV